MPISNKKVSLIGLDPLQGRMIVLLWQQFLNAKDNDKEAATISFMEMVQLCREQEPLAVDMGLRLENLHMTVGCGEGCMHKPGDET